MGSVIDSTSYVVGVDGGATASRAVALGLNGTQLGSGVSGGANPNAHPPQVAAGHVAQALRGALHGLDPAAAARAVIGLAGSSKLTDPDVATTFEQAWRSVGLHCPVSVRTDSEVAFAAATPAPDGTALVAGTGSVAARIAGHRLVNTIGGFGWLLGDEGSAYWLGRAAIRAALYSLQGVEPAGPLVHSVLAEALGGHDQDAPPRQTFARLITTVNTEPPIHLARFAPLVSAAATAADPVAERILDDTVTELVATALAAREPDERTPVVLSGGLIGPGGPLTERLRDQLTRQCGGEVLLTGEHTAGAAGAAWLAAVDLLGDSAPRPT